MSINRLQLNRLCLSLKSEDKSHRKESVRELHSTLLEDSYEWNLETSLNVWEIVENDLATLLTDDMEFCRNTCAEIWKIFIKILPVSEKRVVRLIPILSRWLGSQELLETSEEVRLNYLKLLTLVVDKYQENLSIYCDDLFAITSRTVTDSYPEIKRESCNLIVSFSKSMHAQFFAKSETLVRPVLSNFAHNHWRVRVASVSAIGQILLSGNSKSIEDVATPMAERLFDQSAAVRRAVIDVAGLWLLELRDRYSWWHKLLPLLLTGLHDEVESVRERANDLWDKTGERYLSENENDEKLKDKRDLSQSVENYPSNVTRANLGCRVLVEQNFCKLIGGITRELGDWLADIRVRSAQLLCVLVLNAEASVTQHVEKLLPAMYRACNDEDSRVVVNVELATYYMAHFVPPSIWWAHIRPSLEEAITPGHLRVLQHLIHGSNRDRLKTQWKAILNFLKQSHVCRNSKPQCREQLARCLENIVEKGNVFGNQSTNVQTWKVYRENVVIIAVTLAATSQEDSVLLIVEKVIDKIVKDSDISRDEYIYRVIGPILHDLASSCESWTFHSEELKIFRFLLNYANAACWHHCDAIWCIMKSTMNDKADPEMRLQLFISLANLLENKHHVERFDSHAAWILYEIVFPELVWKPGKVAETIRCAAVCCLCAILDCRRTEDQNIRKPWRQKIFEKMEVVTPSSLNDNEVACTPMFARDEKTIAEDCSSLMKNLVPILASLVDDHAKKTRLYALRTIGRLFSTGKRFEVVNDVDIHEIYPPVLKRLDDGCDNVRSVACEALVCIWEARPENYDVIVSRGQVDYLYTSAIVHLDDPDVHFQSRMLDGLVKLAKIHPCLLAEKIEKCRGNFRNQAGLDKLLATCHDCLQANK